MPERPLADLRYTADDGTETAAYYGGEGPAYDAAVDAYLAAHPEMDPDGDDA